jgi:glycosyltransferase involved in cell wall biosynthesis
VVVIPAYNAAGTIGPLIRRVKQLRLEVVVVNDGSRDETGRAAADAGAMVISHARNQGKGCALRTGFAFALQGGYDVIVTMDGDGQHDPADIPRLLDAVRTSSSAIVVGNRLADGMRMPLARRCTNRLMSCLVSLLSRQSIPDSQCGFRAISRQALSSIRLITCRFELETELLLAAARRGWTVASVPVRTIYRNHPSHIRPLADGWRFVRLVVRHLFSRR